jgi:ABC-2 type transport system ATP-binding protein
MEPYHEFLDVRIRKVGETSNAELAKLIFDHFEVVSYEEELPTMNDVFIQTVTN